jgi:ABC-type glycerol-3-phosphate transport system substrate-binding protein
VDGEWAVAGNPTIPFGMQSLPAGGKPAQTFLGGNLWAIFRYSKNKDLAIELARIMSSPDIQYLYWKELGGLPVTNDTYAAHPDAREGPWAAMYQAAQSAEPLPWSPAFSQVSPLLSAALKPSFAEIASTGSYSAPNLKAQLATANQKFAAALKGAG